jgi:putative NADH-flavin reductase
MMQLALFGATGGTGEQIVRQALKAGHSLRLLVRDPAKLKSQDPRLTVITGNVLTPADVNETLTGADAVICTLGNTRNNPEQVVSNGTRNIISAMQLNAIRRLIVVSSLGVGDSKDQVPFFFKVVAATFLRKVMRDKEALVRTSGLDWTLVRPGGLTDGPRTGAYQFGVDPTIRAGQVSRADVADFVLREVERNEFIGMAPAIT